ncbi:monocarboxylate transporter 9 isoform X2 [Ischnura elegans]|nr:monocarboxylate transporter 9 isoform X2 [Ischnura elegans]XP_046398563.1 monocarboxylate transporter 9 isoform X2 [Ischnura elegans]
MENSVVKKGGAKEKSENEREMEGALIYEKPDGGWGWIVVLGVALMNMTAQSLVSSFGLLFGDWLEARGESTTRAAIIMSVMVATTNLSGLMTGPVIRRFSYRKVAMTGGILTASGIVITSRCDEIWQVIICYSMMAGLGLGFILPSSFVAINAYFTEKRGRAVGFSLAGTGIGQMLMPQAVRALLDEYGFRGAMLILGAVASHSIAGSAVFHPVHWHARVREPAPGEEGGGGGKEMPLLGIATLIEQPESKSERLHPPLAAGDAEEEAEDEVADLRGRMLRRASSSAGQSLRPVSVERRRSSLTPPPRWMTRKASCVSVTSVDVGLPVEMLAGLSIEELPKEEGAKKKGCWDKVVAFMDLNLLGDPVFVNVVVGLALVYSAGINFAMVFPFYLSSIGFSKAETATCMSTLAGADILSRVALPSITDKLGAGNRKTFLVGVVCLAISRSVIAELRDYYTLLIVSAICGFVRGSTVVNFNLSIAEHCSSAQLPAALGINMVMKGVSILILGPVLGWVRDYSGSYSLCIHVPNTLLLLTGAFWVAEMIIVSRRRNATANGDCKKLPNSYGKKKGDVSAFSRQ